MRRLDQWLANLGYCSRREARAWVEAGRVTVRGEASVDFGAKADPADVRVDGEPLDHPEGLLLLLHKPVGLVCSHDGHEGPSIYGLLRYAGRGAIAGDEHRTARQRNERLLLLTDPSALVHRLTSPKHKVPKVYAATLASEMPADRAAGADRTLRQRHARPRRRERTLCTGHAATARSSHRRAHPDRGRYHQVRRMFASQGFEVVTLHRERFGDLTLEALRRTMA